MSEQEAQYEANYQAFIDEVKQSKQVWGLTTRDEEDAWAICPSALYEETDVMPFWSTEKLADAHCIDDWQIYRPAAIALEEFLQDWLPGLHEDDSLVGTNWDMELAGLEVEPADLAEELLDS